MTDTELIVASRTDPRAFRELYDRWAERQEVEQRAVRRLGIEVPRLDVESIARIEALADAAEHRELLADAMTRMTGGEREAVELRVVDELAYAEIAARLDCTENTARRRVHRGPARLNTLMQAEATP